MAIIVQGNITHSDEEALYNFVDGEEIPVGLLSAGQLQALHAAGAVLITGNDAASLVVDDDDDDEDGDDDN